MEDPQVVTAILEGQLKKAPAERLTDGKLCSPRARGIAQPQMFTRQALPDLFFRHSMLGQVLPMTVYRLHWFRLSFPSCIITALQQRIIQKLNYFTSSIFSLGNAQMGQFLIVTSVVV